jgi:PAS domain S-box-containing protein
MGTPGAVPAGVPPHLLVAAPLLLLALVAARLVGRRRRQVGKVEGEPPTASRDESKLAFVALEGALGEISAARETLQRQRDRAEAKRKEAERYNALVLSSIHSGVVSLSERGMVRTANPPAGEILGVHPLTLVGLPLTDCLRECPAVEQGVAAVLAGSDAVSRREVEVTSPNGKRLWLGVSLSGLHGFRGEICGAVLLFSDLTEVRRLRGQVELKRRLESMGEMLAAIAHECRNAMGAVTGYARLLERGQLGEDERVSAVEGILREVAAIESVLGECLDFVRPRPLRRRSVDLIELLAGVVNGTRSLAEAADVRVELTPHLSCGTVEVDPDQFRQALSNLVRNAIQASFAGGRVDICVVTHDEGQCFEVAIADHGVGIAEETLEHIFDPFFTTRAEGTGLGMSIAQRVIIAHAGRLEIDSVVGQGTTVRAIVPINDSQGAETV